VPQALEKLREENQYPAYGNIGIHRPHPEKILVYIQPNKCLHFKRHKALWPFLSFILYIL
jgi:hypothetical protein